MKRSFSWRVFTSFGLFLSFIMILVSGIILYIFPGRTPGFMWEIWGMNKPAWQNQHIIFGFSFSILSLCHLFFINWKAFFSYLKSKTKEGLQSPRELLVIVALSLLFGAGTFFKIQPFSGILEFGKSISRSWDNSAQQGSEKRVDIYGYSQELAFADLPAERGSGEDDFYGRERHHRHGDMERGFRHNTDEGRVSSITPQFANRRQETAAPVDSSPSARAGKNEQQISDVQAPDDELHRRTNASCESCHNTSRW